MNNGIQLDLDTWIVPGQILDNLVYQTIFSFSFAGIQHGPPRNEMVEFNFEYFPSPLHKV